MRSLAYAFSFIFVVAAGSTGCAAIIGLDSGDPLPGDGGEDEGGAADAAKDSGTANDSAVAVDTGPACAPDTADCDGDPKNGCEAKLGTPMHCGSCTDTCGIGKQCQGGVCCVGPNMFCLQASDCCTNKCDGNKCSPKP